MRWPYGWLLPAIALAGTGLAIWAGSDITLALPGAVVAVTAAGLLFAEVWFRSVPSERRPRPLPPRDTVAEIRSSFRSGRFGREELVLALDRLERAGPHPNLPGRRIEEINELDRMSVNEFRRYVRGRLDYLEEWT